METETAARAADAERRARWSSWLRARMAERGYTVRALADAAGVSRGTVGAWMHGGSPLLETAPALAAALDVGVRELAEACAGKR